MRTTTAFLGQFYAPFCHPAPVERAQSAGKNIAIAHGRQLGRLGRQIQIRAWRSPFTVASIPPLDRFLQPKTILPGHHPLISAPYR